MATFPIDLAAHIEQFRARVLQDALTEATAAYWERRARRIEDAAPGPGDFHGSASRSELRARSDRCHEAAKACRRHAQLLREGEPDQPVSDEVRATLREAL